MRRASSAASRTAADDSSSPAVATRMLNGAALRRPRTAVVADDAVDEDMTPPRVVLARPKIGPMSAGSVGDRSYMVHSNGSRMDIVVVQALVRSAHQQHWETAIAQKPLDDAADQQPRRAAAVRSHRNE